MKTVLFLGAGFSAPFDLPVMNGFFNSARDSDFLNSAEKQFLEQVQRFAHMGVRLISIQRNNLEAILSFLTIAEHLRIRPKEIRDALEKCAEQSAGVLLRKIMARIYGPLDLESLESQQSAFRELVRIKDDGAAKDDLTIVTTNYDIVAETLMLQVHHRVWLPGPRELWQSCSGRSFEQDNSCSLYDLKSTTKICKLHGSVSWKDTSDPQNKHTFAVVNRVQNMGTRGSDKSFFTPEAATAEFHRESTAAPIIVAPTLFKHQTDARFEAIWAEAGYALQTADRILFVGYSFPESDTYMRYFFGASLVENVNLEGVGILDKRAGEISKKLTQDDHYGGHFKDLLRPIEGDWTTVRSPWEKVC